MLKTSDLKINFLGVIPNLTEDSGILTAEQLVALSALLTFKGKSVKELVKEALTKGQDLQQKTRAILAKSSLRGHASMATTPALALSFEGSKFLDSMLTGIVFASGLMSSGRRTATVPEEIVFPTALWQNREAGKIYARQARRNIEVFNWLLAQGVAKDEASKILQYGIYGTGVLVLPVESLVGFAREYKLEKAWLPEEAGLFLKRVRRELPKLGLFDLFKTRLAAPREIYPYPNLFKNPKNSNLARELATAFDGRKNSGEFFKIAAWQILPSKGLRQSLRKLNRLTKKICQDKKAILERWPELLALRRKICRDYNLAVQVMVRSSVAWRVWGDKKRHRTVPQSVESIYFCLERAIKNLKLAKQNVVKFDTFFAVPPTIKNKPALLKPYLQAAVASFKSYRQLCRLGIKPRDAIFIIPRGLRIGVCQSYNLYNLIAGYYPLRLCSTAEEQLLKLSQQEAGAIRTLFNKQGWPELAEAMSVKCHHTGFCHEEKFCGQIKTLVKDYDEEFHRQVAASLLKKSAKEGKWRV